MRHREHQTPPEPDAAGATLAHALGAVANLTDAMQQLHIGMKSRDAARLQGADPRQVSVAFGAAGNPGMVSGNSNGLIYGINLRETAGVATVVRVLDGVDASGMLLWGTILAPNAERTEEFDYGVSYTSGIYVQLVSGGAVEGVIYQSGGQPR